MIATKLSLPTLQWEFLQQLESQGGLLPQCRLLLAALEQGWHVEEPVYRRPRWGEHNAPVYQFVLRHRDFPKCCLLTVPNAPLIESLVGREHWQVMA